MLGGIKFPCGTSLTTRVRARRRDRSRWARCRVSGSYAAVVMSTRADGDFSSFVGGP